MIDEKIEILLKEYDSRRTEIAWHTDRYHKQIKFITIYFTILTTIIGLLTQQKDLLKTIPPLYLSFITYIILIVTPIVGFYLFSVILDALFMLYINGIRSGAIEKKINKIKDDNIIIWDSIIISHLFSSQFLYKDSWVKPNFLITIWGFSIFIIINTFLCILSSTLDSQLFFWIYNPIIIILTIFHLYQLIAINSTGIYYLNNYIYKESGLTFEKDFNKSKNHKGIFLIPFLTIVFGYIPMYINALSNDAFLPSSKHPFPFLLNISVTIGDLIFLPIFNYLIFKLLVILKNDIKIQHLIILIAIIIVSILIQYNIHQIWITDSYTGFMDIELGKLSFAGWWHLFFSIIETIFVLSLLSFTFLFKKQVPKILRVSLKAWYIFFFYSLLSLIDLYIQSKVILNYISTFEYLLNNFLAILKIIIVVGFLCYLIFLNKKKK